MIHAETLQSIPGCELAAICNRNPERLKAAAAGFSDVVATTDYRTLLNMPDLDVISITTHWQEHFELARAALASGRHVFLEKPMAASGEESSQLAALASEAAGYLMVGHICRFDPRCSLARASIQAGQIGRIVSMHAKRNLPKGPRHLRLDKISPLMGDGVHDADLMMWFMQRMPSRVYGRTIRTGDYACPSLGWAMLEFDQDAVGVIETVWCLPDSVPTVIDARLEVVGTEGMLTIDCANTGLQVVTAEGPEMKDTAYWPSQHGHRVGALAAELAYFADCVRHHSAPAVITPREAAQAVIVMEAAENSASRGQPVDIAPMELSAN